MKDGFANGKKNIVKMHKKIKQNLCISTFRTKNR